MKYISIDTLQAYCDNQKDHNITPNDFQRMEHIEIVLCKDCKRYIEQYHECDALNRGCIKSDFFCGYGERKDGDENDNSFSMEGWNADCKMGKNQL